VNPVRGEEARNRRVGSLVFRKRGRRKEKTMTTRKKLLIVTAVALAVVATGAVVAGNGGFGHQGSYGRHGDGRGRGGMRWMAQELDLTQEQRQQIRNILQERWLKGMGDAAKTARLAHRDLRDAIHDPAAAEQAVRDAARKAAAADETLAVERHKTAIAVMGVLTDEQKTKAKAMRDERRERLGQRFGGDWGGPPDFE
jgi:Spy/CpxP family protein refolding chaperone